MSAVNVNAIYPIFTDIDGQPLEDGYVWIGVSGLEPQANPQTAYWDAALTQVATQPVRTRGGYPLNGTAIGRLFTAAPYSIKVQNKRTSTIATELDTSVISSSASVSFLQSGVGAVERTVQSKMRDVVSVKDFGAVGDGVADDTLAIQAAITEAAAKELVFPPGTYRITATLNISNGMTLTGSGITASGFSWTNTGLNVINVSTDSAIVIRDLFFNAPSSAGSPTSTSGSVITLAGLTGGGNTYSAIENCWFQYGYDVIVFESTVACKIANNVMYAWARRGLTLRNTLNADAGDAYVVSNTFSGPGGGSSVCVYQVNSGGAKFVGNKFNTGAYGFLYDVSNAAVGLTSDLLFSSNSFENASIANMAFTATAGAASNVFTNIVITGNQFALAPINLQFSGNYNAFGQVTVTGNTFAINNGGTYCINADFVSNLNIGDNTFTCGTGTPTAINIGANTSGVISDNTFNQTPGLWGAKITSASGSMYRTRYIVRSGTEAVTCNIAYGSLFAATGTVTFSSAFDSVPTVVANQNTISGGVGVSVYSVTASGFSYAALSVTSGATGSISWTATGVY